MARKKEVATIDSAKAGSGSQVWIDYEYHSYDHEPDGNGGWKRVLKEAIPCLFQVLMISIESTNMRGRLYRKDTGEIYLGGLDLPATTFFDQMQIIPK